MILIDSESIKYQILSVLKDGTDVDLQIWNCLLRDNRPIYFYIVTDLWLRSADLKEAVSKGRDSLFLFVYLFGNELKYSIFQRRKRLLQQPLFDSADYKSAPA